MVSPTSPLDPTWTVADWAGTWMNLVYRLARERRPESLLRVQEASSWNGCTLPDGMTVASLPIRVFEASAYAADLLAESAEAHEPRSAPPAPDSRIEDVFGWEDVLAPIRFYVRAYYNQGTDITGHEDPFFYDLMTAEFGLRREEVGVLTMGHVRDLFRFAHRVRSAPTDDARHRSLAEIAEFRDQLLGQISDEINRVAAEHAESRHEPANHLGLASKTYFHKALDRFPAPDPSPKPGLSVGGNGIAAREPKNPPPGPPEPRLSTGVNAIASASVRLTDRQELILDAVAELGQDGPGPWRGKVISARARLDHDSRVRTDLSTLCKLGFLRNVGAGYVRTDKPYPCP